MDIFNVFTMLGGLALFLYGMHIMGDGLAKLSGGKLERLLENLTSTSIKAVVLGAAVTAVIQSSSATTVMVVGFVNSGIMKLAQAAPIIMGANIGTTITSWILSLSGIESSNFFISLIKPTSFSPVLALIGVILFMFNKKEKNKDIGLMLLGFSILMTGMETMSGAMEPLKDSEGFKNVFTMFSNPILGMLAGTLLTAVLQSSSASIGILQALCRSGNVYYSAALPIIMGQNIGTCVTALISGIGASKNAKRASLVHLYFNVIGTVIFMVAFYSINAFVNFAFLENPANVAGIAMIHSIFNVVATIALLPFVKQLEKLAYLTIKEDEVEEKVEDNEFKLLDPRFLDTPAFAIQQCKELTVKMAELAKKALFNAMTLVNEEYREEVVEKVSAIEKRVDQYEDELGSYLIKLSSKNLSEKDSCTLSMLLHCIGEFERISDHATNIMEAGREMHEKGMSFSDRAKEELDVFTRAVQDVVNITMQVFEQEDTKLAVTVEPLEEVVDYLNAEVKARHIKRLTKGDCTIELGFVLSDITTNYERVADHCSNVAVCLIQLENKEFDTHEYIEMIKSEENVAFKEKYKAYKKQYVLP